MRRVRRPALLSLAALAALWLITCSDSSFSLGSYYKGRTLHLAVMEIKRAPEILYATIDPEEVSRHYRLLPSEQDQELVLVRLKVENHTATSAIFTVDQQSAELWDFFSGSHQPVDISNRVFQDMRWKLSATVHLSDGQCFDPKRLNISPGTTVNWVNDDNVDHFVNLDSVAGRTETTEPPPIEPGESFSFLFEESGEWNYRCGDSEFTEGTASVLVENDSTTDTVDEQAMVFITGTFELPQGHSVDGWMVFEAPKGTKFRSMRWRAGDSITIDF